MWSFVSVKLDSVTSQVLFEQTHLSFHCPGIPASVLTYRISTQTCLKQLEKFSTHHSLGNFLLTVNTLMVKKYT